MGTLFIQNKSFNGFVKSCNNWMSGENLVLKLGSLRILNKTTKNSFKIYLCFYLCLSRKPLTMLELLMDLEACMDMSKIPSYISAAYEDIELQISGLVHWIF